MKISAIALATTLLLASCSPPPLPLEQHAWRLSLPDGGGGSAVPVKIAPRIDAPGFVVHFLTAKHVAQHSPDGWQATIGERILTGGHVVSEHPELDLAVISFHADSPVDVVQFASKQPAVGDVLTCVGYAKPADRALWVSQGICSGPGRATLQSWYGDSGGAILNTDRQLVGILVGGYLSPQDSVMPGKSRYCPTASAWEWIEARLR